MRAKSIDISKVERFAIKKGKFRVHIGGQEVLTVPIKELDKFIRPSCRVCEDFTAEFADISVGGVGCPEGLSTVITRTARGHDFLTEAERSGWLVLKAIDPGKHGMEQILKLSVSKKASAQNTLLATLTPARPMTQDAATCSTMT